MTAALACMTCGAELRSSAVLPRLRRVRRRWPKAHAEYKQVTVLFADVVHSMDIAAAVGAERLREIMTELVDRCAAVVQRYGGTVDKFTGDGIMAVFGAPVALEDHAAAGLSGGLGHSGGDRAAWRPRSSDVTASTCGCGSGSIRVR